MATKWFNVKGIVKWAKVYDPDAFMGAENWKVNFAPIDDSEMEKFKASGIQTQFKKDPGDGMEYAQLRRGVKKVFNDEVVFFTPPFIRGAVNVSYQDDEGNEVRQYKKGDKFNVVGEKTPIGNGSEVIINFCVYDTVKGKGHRLEGMTVTSLVPYDAPAVEKPAEVKKEEPKKKEVEVKNFSKELDDEIPF